jgi:hypothetical protein
VAEHEYKGVDVNHPSIVKAMTSMVKQGIPKERAMKLTGMPAEVVDKHYKKIREESK